MGGPPGKIAKSSEQSEGAEQSPSASAKPKAGLLKLEAVLKNGRATPEVVVEILERYPAEQPELLEKLNQDPRYGMSFTHKVIGIMTKPRGQRPQPASGAHSDNEIPIEPEGLYSPTRPSRPTVMLDDGDTVQEKGRHEKKENKGDKGVGISASNPRWKTIATQIESIVETDSAGDTLVINAEYKLEERPGETEITETHLETNRDLVLTLANGEKIYAHLHGEAIALIEANAKLDPTREIHEHSVGAHNTGSVYLPATEESPPTVIGEDKDTLAKSISNDGLLDYDNPLKQLAALKAVMKRKGVASGGSAIGQAHRQAKLLRQDHARVANDVRQHIAHVKNFEDGDPTSIARAEDYIREINDTLHTISSNRVDASDDVKELAQIRMEMFALVQEARSTTTPTKSFGRHALDVLEAPGRLVKRIGEGGVELGATLIDFSMLSAAWLADKAHIGKFEWDPISSAGKAAQDGATSGDILKGIATGFVDEWSTAIEHARHGDYSKILDAGIDTALLAQSAADVVEFASVRTPQLVGKVARLAKTAGEIVASAKAPTEVLDRVSAIAETIKVWADEGRSPAMQMSGHGSGTGGPPGGGGGVPLGDAKKAGQLKKLATTRDRAVKSVGERTKDVKLKEFSAHVEDKVFIGDPVRATNYFYALELNPGITSEYFTIVEAISRDPVIGTTDMMTVLDASVTGRYNATEFVRGVQKILAKDLDRPTTLKLIERASKGKVDLLWLGSSHATKTELRALVRNENTPFNNLQDAARDYAQGKALPQNDALAIDGNMRGTAAEIVAEENLPAGFKLDGVSAGKGADFPLVDAQGNLAALEVKGGDGASWSYELQQIGQGVKTPKWQRMERQLRGALAKGKRTFLGISSDLSEADEKSIQAQLKKDGMSVEIHRIDATKINQVELSLRSHLGLPS